MGNTLLLTASWPTFQVCHSSFLLQCIDLQSALRKNHQEGEAAAGLCSEPLKRHIEKMGFGKRCREWCVCVRGRTVTGRG